MRHRKRVAKLSRKNKHRVMMLRNMATDIIKNGRITTTVVKAKAVRPVVERLITYGKKNTLASKRNALKVLTQKDYLYTLFNVIAPYYAERNGGYTRVLKVDKKRFGDNGDVAIIELVGYEDFIEQANKYLANFKGTEEEVVEAEESSAE